MLLRQFLSAIRQISSEFIFEQDSSPAHRALETISFLWPPCVADADIMFLPCGFFFFFFPRLISVVADWMSACPHNMSNIGPLTAEIGLPVWGTPANFNGFRVLAALLHGTRAERCSARQPKFAALNTGRHLHSEGRPLRWALAHILVLHKFAKY